MGTNCRADWHITPYADLFERHTPTNGVDGCSRDRTSNILNFSGFRIPEADGFYGIS